MSSVIFPIHSVFILHEVLLIYRNCPNIAVTVMKVNPQITNPYVLYIDQIIQIPDLLPVPTQVDIVESNAEDI